MIFLYASGTIAHNDFIGNPNSDSFVSNNPLDTFNCTNTVSSFVHRICYQPDAKYVVVMLKHTHYHYCDMDEQTVSEWLDAKSKGRFYNRRVKNAAVNSRFSCKGKHVPNFN